MNSIVLDTNVLISGMINARGAPGQILDLVRGSVIELVVDDRILDEYVFVLRRARFRRYFAEAECEDIIGYLENNEDRPYDMLL